MTRIIASNMVEQHIPKDLVAASNFRRENWAPYTSLHFVGRNQELSLVQDRMNRASYNGVTTPVLNFWGVGGIGKTWLLRHLYELWRTQSNPANYQTTTQMHTFSQPLAPLDELDLTQDLSQQVIEQSGPLITHHQRQMLQKAYDQGEFPYLVDTLKELARTGIVPLVLLDNVQMLTPDDWHQLEQSLIEPLVTDNNMVVVVAGDKPNRWRPFELRRRISDIGKTELRPFTLDEAQQLIRARGYKLTKNDIAALYPYTAGHPAFIDHLAHTLTEWKRHAAPNLPIPQLIIQHQQDMLSLTQGAEDELLKKIEPRLRSALEALSPLRFYRVEAARYMIPTEHPNLPDGFYLGILRELEQNTEVVKWERASRAYQTNDIVRRLLNQRHFLEREKYSTFVDGHQKTSDMYLKWINQYKEASEDFILEYIYHQLQIYRATGDENTLQKRIENVLHVTLHSLKTDRLLSLRNQLDFDIGDRELADLLPSGFHASLLADLDNRLNT